MSCSSGRTAQAAAISILAATGASAYVSDRLGFHHCDSGLSGIRTETGRTREPPGKVPWDRETDGEI